MEKTASLCRVLFGVEVLLEGQPGEHGAEEGAEELAAEVDERLAPTSMLPSIQLGDGHRGVEVRAAGERDVDAGEDAEAPPEVDEQPAAAETLAPARMAVATTPQPSSSSIAVPSVS